MKTSYNWLKELVSLDVSPEELPAHLLKLGFEVESIETLGPSFSGVVVGEVLEVARHPNADRLRLCKISDGKETFSVVCGAPNVAAGQRVPFAKIGALLPGDFKIKKSKIRGEVSHGMICSAEELRLPENGKKENGILVLPADSAVGADFGEEMGESDAIFDVNITPNRPDCLSHLGLARELAAHFGLPLKSPAAAPDAGAGGPAPFPVETGDSSQCARYLGRMIADVKVGPSPQWLQSRLKSIGLRPINNVVDVTNFILHETGQPLHAFDADKIRGGKIVVRNAAAGEKILALDGREYSLAPADLVIADKERPVAVAGVIGGEETAVTAATTRVFLECAHFSPARVRKSSKRLGIRTDSSYRFERGADAAAAPLRAQRAVSLILELCGGTAGPAADTNPHVPSRPGIEASAARINKILGTDHPEDRITAVLKALSADLRRAGDLLTFYPPSYRPDLENIWDLAEEAGRHLGYSAVPARAASVSLPAPEVLPVHELSEKLRDRLAGLGLREAYNYDFLSETEIKLHYQDKLRPDGCVRFEDYLKLHNPISEDWQYLRADLLPGLLKNARTNFNRGAKGVKLFEFGHVYAKEDGCVRETARVAGLLAGKSPAAPHWNAEQKDADFYDVKGVVEALLAGTGAAPSELSRKDGIYHPKAALDIALGGKAIGRFGMLHPLRLAAWDISLPAAAFELDLGALAPAEEKRREFKPFSVFPSSSRDISILAEAELPYARVEEALRAAEVAELIRADLVDVFTGAGIPAGKKSLTIRLTFSRPDRTLRDEETQRNMDKLLAALETRCGARLRS